MIRKPAHKDTNNPPGQIDKLIPGPDTLQFNIAEWKRLQEQRNKEKFHPEKETCGACRCQFEEQCLNRKD